MEKVNRKTTKLCSFYVSDWHLVTMILPYLNEQINKEISFFLNINVLFC